MGASKPSPFVGRKEDSSGKEKVYMGEKQSVEQLNITGTQGKRLPMGKTHTWDQRIRRLVKDPIMFCRRNGINLEQYYALQKAKPGQRSGSLWVTYDRIRRGLENDLGRPVSWDQLLYDPELGQTDFGVLHEWPCRWCIAYGERPKELNTLGKRIEYLLERRGWTTSFVEDLSDVTRGTISKIAKGKTLYPKMWFIQELVMIFGCTYDWLLGGLEDTRVPRGPKTQ